jgi:2-methylcitrate dehydratase PrpD
MSVLDKITGYLVETDYEDLPADVVEVTKKQVLDTLAAMVGGSTCSISGELDGLVDLVKGWGGKEESTIVAFGGRVPAPDAGFVNGVLCVRLDFDDTQVMGMRIHPSRAVVPTAFALAERQGDITGRELITAVALGHDLECRLKIAVGRDLNSPLGMVTNFFGAAATAGKLLGLDEEKLGHALSLAYHQISGAKSRAGTAGAGTSVKGVNNGIVVKSGIVSALLADRGFASSPDFLEAENKRNLYQIFFSGYYEPSLLTADLGKVFAGLNTSHKEYPCCHGQHTAIRAALGLLGEQDIKPDDVAEVLLRVSPFDYDYLAQPVEEKQDPKNIIEAQFSLYWGVASAIVYGKVNIGNFTAAALGDTRVREMVRRVSVRADSELAREQGFTPAIVEIKTKGGGVYSKQVDQPFGSPAEPMEFTDLARKFRHCCQYSIRPVASENQDEVIRLVERLEEVSDVGQIVRRLA